MIYITLNNNTYAVNGIPNNPPISLIRGLTYAFNVNATGQPFYIQTTGNGYNALNAYSTGVTGSGTSVGTVTFAVPLNAPNILYYQSQATSAMFGTINITNS